MSAGPDVLAIAVTAAALMPSYPRAFSAWQSGDYGHGRVDIRWTGGHGHIFLAIIDPIPPTFEIDADGLPVADWPSFASGAR